MPTGGPTIPKLPDAAWRERAACRKEPETSLTPHEGEEEESDRLLANRDLICLGGAGAPCPVRESCLVWALQTKQPTGIWGGKTPAERDPRLRRRFREPA